MSTPRGERPRKSWRRYVPLLINAFALVAVVLVWRVATQKFEWWRKAAFAGEVVGKEAKPREGDTGTPVDDGIALKDSLKFRFFLKIRTAEGVETHEVLARHYGEARVSDYVEKKPGSHNWERRPAAPGSQEPDAEGRVP
jgi:hypothetical protein